jgi:aspartyl-tRNA(Asn)/glutamyl-tRNA(Gln) amidotransferase subunit A
MEIMAGEDPMDSTSSSEPVENYSDLNSSKRKYRIGYLGSALNSDGLQSEIKTAYQRSIDAIIADGHEVDMVELPLLDHVLPVYYVLTTSESSSNLSRFDGIHYGHRSEKAKSLEEVYKFSRSEAFGPEVQRRIMLGTFALSADYYEAYFTKAQQVRRLIQNSAIDLFKKVDFLIMPTTPTTAFKIGEKSTNPLSMYLADIFTVWANLAGIPAINIPAGNDAQGLPIGLQVHADFFKEKEMLDFANVWSKLI